MATRKERAKSRILVCLAESAGYAEMLGRPDLVTGLNELAEQVRDDRVTFALAAHMDAPNSQRENPNVD